MVEINNKAKEDTIMICPKCGSVNLKQTPKIWEQKPGEVVVAECMLCSYKGRDFPVIKKTTVNLFRQKLNKR